MKTYDYETIMKMINDAMELHLASSFHTQFPKNEADPCDGCDYSPVDCAGLSNCVKLKRSKTDIVIPVSPMDLQKRLNEYQEFHNAVCGSKDIDLRERDATIKAKSEKITELKKDATRMAELILCYKEAFGTDAYDCFHIARKYVPEKPL